jgi:hypothetical protein
MLRTGFDERYCPRDRTLLRNACYWTANDMFKKEDRDNAVYLYAKGMISAESNTKGTHDPAALLFLDLGKWAHEGEDNAPCYYLAYNASCACSRSGKYAEALKWLKAAVRMNGQLRSNAKKDPDLAALREHNPDAFTQALSN